MANPDTLNRHCAGDASEHETSLLRDPLEPGTKLMSEILKEPKQ